MPHVIIETSQNLNLTMPNELLADITQKLWESGEFGKPEDIKARLYPAPFSLIGTQQSNQQNSDTFIIVTFYLMKGRDDMVKQALVARIAKALTTHIQDHEKIDTQGKLQICVNPIELNDNYKKITI